MAVSTQYIPSEKVKAAEAAMKVQKNSRPEAYRSAWEDQIKAAMETILSREPFRYSINGDALYRQYQEQAIRNGRLAMMDTMGQAAALTGGYGNSYAQTAGQQMYQQQLLSLNDRIPELYALALDQYKAQGDALQQRYDLLSGREQQDYSRYKDTLAAWQKDADWLWNLYSSERDFDYGGYRDRIADAQWQAEFDEAKRRYDQEWADAHQPVETSVVYYGSSSSNSSSKTAKKAASDKGKKTASHSVQVTL